MLKFIFEKFYTFVVSYTIPCVFMLSFDAFSGKIVMRMKDKVHTYFLYFLTALYISKYLYVFTD